ncbi:kinase-like domain-containing protein [Crucibulum laeve]|uniref:Kinase-like domain-containing protein n=1 Tax=Crucibulum laeve TaxID=68775 RepID=A0A5C3LWV9_9AGAR|nr:kinase-like domain-containing protein [Crucibulum laeve]
MASVSSSLVTGSPFSDVYRGDFNGKEVAIKRVRFSGSREEISRSKKALLIGIQYGTSIQHPNILCPVPMPTYSTISIQNIPWDDMGPSSVSLMSPWMINGNISDYLRNHQGLNKMTLINDIAEGLAYLHNKGVVHGNLHPHNVLVQDNGVPVLSDFGLSNILSNIERSSMSHYQSPELILGISRNVPTPMSDVWSFGCVTLELLINNSPFDDCHGDLALVMALYQEQHPFKTDDLSAAEKPFNEAAWPLVMTCFNYNPGGRAGIDEIHSSIRQRGQEYPSPRRVGEGANKARL